LLSSISKIDLNQCNVLSQIQRKLNLVNIYYDQQCQKLFLNLEIRHH
jgi:hypothetical protein